MPVIEATHGLAVQPNHVYVIPPGKAEREHNHSHADWGQICIDGYGERLIVDLGSTPGYPPQSRWLYYNFQQWGHNVLVIGEPGETGGISGDSVLAGQGGEIRKAQFDDRLGAAWSFELSPVYTGARQVHRTVVHLLPRVVVVLDEAVLDEEMPISLRWHTAEPPRLRADGRFEMEGKRAAMLGQLVRLDGDSEIGVGRHAYRPPYNTDRLGEPYPQRREPFVEMKASAERCQFLTLICILERHDDRRAWNWAGLSGSIETPEGVVNVSVGPDRVTAEITGTNNRLAVDLG